MSLFVTLWEDTGALTLGHGLTRAQVSNIGWKSIGNDDTNFYAYNPLIRPVKDGDTMLVFSYKKYNYFKIVGTYSTGARPRIIINSDIEGDAPKAPPSDPADPTTALPYPSTKKIRLFYKLTNVYEQPNNVWDGSLIYIPTKTTLVLYPTLSTSGPESATTYPQHLIGSATYYSQYLVTQLAVEQEDGTYADFGNIGKVEITFDMDEYEGTNV